jgi:hypothetical protein
MSRLSFASALFLALLAPTLLLSPFANSSSQSQQTEITIAAALEARAPENSDVDIGLGAPQVAGQGADIDSGQVNVLYLWSNTAWDSTIVAEQETMVSSDNRQRPTSLLQPLLYGTTNIPASTVPLGQPAAVVNDGPANTSNNAQEYPLYFRQPISWGDEAGQYSITLTHGLSNS